MVSLTEAYDINDDVLCISLFFGQIICFRIQCFQHDETTIKFRVGHRTLQFFFKGVEGGNKIKE